MSNPSPASQQAFQQGLQYDQQGNCEAAEQAFRLAARHSSEWNAPWFYLGRLHHRRGEPRHTLSAFKKALAGPLPEPLRLEALCHLIQLLESMGMPQQADDYLRQAKHLAPDHPEVMALELDLSFQRRTKDTQRLLQGLLQQHPHNHNGLSIAVKTAGPKDDALIRQAELALLQSTMPLPAQATLHYALLDWYDRNACHEQAILHAHAANKKIGSGDFSIENFRYETDQLMVQFSKEKMAGYQHNNKRGKAWQTPIFIVGMPRSGTSLTEQILCSHPDVHGAGERYALQQLAHDLPGYLSHPKRFPHCMDAWQEPSRLAFDYLNDLRDTTPDHVRYITDKMPHNFALLGLVQLLFPEARIIHCVRDPRDTCLSCYFQNFASGHNYSRNLAVMGDYYNEYQRIMNHWQKVLNLSWLTLPYESVVQDTATWVRKLLDFCDLPFDERCLRFNDNPRRVFTASQHQVKRGIYHSSVGKWRHYQAWLAPLLQHLDQGDMGL